MFESLKKILDKIGSPELDWIQVEVTSLCNAGCIYCPNPLIARKQHMPPALFNRLLPYLSYTDLVYLQGWGEPLLNKDLFDMIKQCKSKGKRVGFTTNGMLLSDENIRKIIDLNVDILCISLAGTISTTHNRIRKGTDFLKIISNIERLQQIKAQIGAMRPSLHFAYILLMENFHEIQKIVELSSSLGVKEVVASNLTLITQKSLYSQALFNHPEKWQYFIDMFDEVANEARHCNLSFSTSSPIPEKAFRPCRENICCSSFISADGEVSPCVFTSPTISRLKDGEKERNMPHIFQKRRHSLNLLSFGNIETENFNRIWNKKAYIEFRKYFDPEKTQTSANTRVGPLSCLRCYKGLNV